MNKCGKCGPYGGEKKSGLQVVKVSQEPGRRYEVDEAALASVLLRPDVRGLPVAVVSVAGTYRGGKSFMLDFFLRFLKASRQRQLSGEWLGDENDVLEGFDWRGGSETHTKGIHLWPEPFIITNECTRQKVAVLLMDTQGTFDTESDMTDNTIIFALSTLLSSVQIYNLQGKICEDHLQHLQLFTEYGRLVCGGEGKAFQTLLFLIRDWINPYEHPYGYEGGQALLNIRLAPFPNQKEELREVRKHIHSCFETLSCFLMPHPGLVVANKDFRGRLRDIEPQFRTSLLELVPSLFEPNNLVTKSINGDKIQAQSLLEFFKKYIEVFNSDELPKATTIFQATADAWIMAAIRECRTIYESMMECNVKADRSVITSMLEEWHQAALVAAIEHFRGKNMLGPKENAESHLLDLERELNGRLTIHVWENDVKVRDTVSAAKNQYEVEVKRVCTEEIRLCLHPADLDRLHDTALAQALTLFKNARGNVLVDQDIDRKGLIEDLNKYYEHLRSLNEKNNKTASLEACDSYEARMMEVVSLAGVTTSMLQSQHEKALAAAIEHFPSRRNFRTKETHDTYEESLRQELNGRLTIYVLENDAKVRDIVSAAKNQYEVEVKRVCTEETRLCLHPADLDRLHDTALAQALTVYTNARGNVPVDQDIDRKGLIEDLNKYYEHLRSLNEKNNKTAFLEARDNYEARMMEVVSLAGVTTSVLQSQHEKALAAAIEHFPSRRNFRTKETHDTYEESLRQELNGRLTIYVLENDAKVRDTVSAAKNQYEVEVKRVCTEENRLCLHPADLDRLHDTALAQALTVYTNARGNVPVDQDIDRKGLIEDLNKYYEHLRSVNEKNNKMAILEARDIYEARMKEVVSLASVTTSVLQSQHEKALAAAIEHFPSRRNFRTKETHDTYEESLRQELNDRLTIYVLENDAKVRDTVSAAKNQYEVEVKRVCTEETRLCLHPADLDRLHDTALAQALTVFDNARGNVPVDQDIDRKGLIEDLNKYYEHLRSGNEQNNKTAILEARDIYEARMKEVVSLAGVSTSVLQSQHKKALAAAIEHFHSRRNFRTKETHDPYEESLQDILANFEEFEKANIQINERAMQLVQNTYMNCMSLSPTCCYHPRAFIALHDTAKQAALDQFCTDRVPSENDDYKKKLIAILDSTFQQLQSTNESYNNQAVNDAFGEYKRLMDHYTKPGGGTIPNIPVLPCFLQLHHALPGHHGTASSSALGVFNGRRRGQSYGDDIHLEDLKRRMADAYSRYESTVRTFTFIPPPPSDLPGCSQQ